MKSPTNKFLLVVTAAVLMACFIGLELQKSDMKLLKLRIIRSKSLSSKIEKSEEESRTGDQTSPSSLNNYFSDGPTSDTEERLRYRRENMIKQCKRQSLYRELPWDVAYVRNPLLKTSLFYSNRYKLLFCQIPKCATRSQAKFLSVIEGLIKPEKNETVSEQKVTCLIEEHRSSRRIRSMEDMTRILDEYVKIVIVREPFSRLLSAFRNKLENNERHDGYAAIARKIHAKYGNCTGEKEDGVPIITLDDFLAYLTDPESGAQVDQHWNFYNVLCAPCDVKYDYIVHMDTIDEDMQYLMKKFQINNFTFPASFSSFTDRKKVDEYFRNASPSLVKALYNKYKLDYDLFGMSPPIQL